MMSYKYPRYVPIKRDPEREIPHMTAEQLARTIRERWAECGHDVKVWVEKGVVHSDLVNGLPVKTNALSTRLRTLIDQFSAWERAALPNAA